MFRGDSFDECPLVISSRRTALSVLVRQFASHFSLFRRSYHICINQPKTSEDLRLFLKLPLASFSFLMANQQDPGFTFPPVEYPSNASAAGSTFSSEIPTMGSAISSMSMQSTGSSTFNLSSFSDANTYPTAASSVRQSDAVSYGQLYNDYRLLLQRLESLNGTVHSLNGNVNSLNGTVHHLINQNGEQKVEIHKLKNTIEQMMKQGIQPKQEAGPEASTAWGLLSRTRCVRGFVTKRARLIICT